MQIGLLIGERGLLIGEKGLLIGGALAAVFKGMRLHVCVGY
jgi:hypothetical protein